MSDSELLTQLAESLTRLSEQMDGLLQLHRRPLGFQPDRLEATRIQIRRNKTLTPKTCLQVWGREAKQARACPSNKLTQLLSNVRSQPVQAGGKCWDELIISGYACPRTGWVDLVSTLGGITSDALLASTYVLGCGSCLAGDIQLSPCRGNGVVRGGAVAITQAVLGANPLTAGIGLVAPNALMLLSQKDQLTEEQYNQKAVSVVGKGALATALVCAGPVGWIGLAGLSVVPVYNKAASLAGGSGYGATAVA